MFEDKLAVGKRCYIVFGKRYTGDNVYYLDGIGTVFVEPSFPNNEVVDSRNIGHIAHRGVGGVRSYFYANIYFVFPSLPVKRDYGYNNNSNPTSYLKYNQIEIDNDIDIIKLSRALIDKMKISCFVVDKNIIEIKDPTQISSAKNYIDGYIENQKSLKPTFFGGLRDKLFPKDKVNKRKSLGKRNTIEDEFPDADFEID